MSKLIKPLIILGVLTQFMACVKDKDLPEQKDAESFNELQVDASFDYETSQKGKVRLTALDNSDNPIEGVKFYVYTDYPDSGGHMLLSGISDASGRYEAKLLLPAYMDEVVVSTEFIGLPSMVKTKVNFGNVDYIFGGSAYRSRNYRSSNGIQSPQLTDHALKYLGTFNTNGVPNYLEKDNDKVSNDLLSDINKSLPELRPVPTYHPNYLASSSESNIVIKEKSEVWLTFVHEGAGYKNVLCFYSYTTGNAPTKVSDIDTLTVVFPNTSFSNSGGGLVSGNKVKLGVFDKNTTIGFALISNGFQSNGTITDGYHIVYTDTDLNPESSSEKRRHNVLLADPGRDLILLGFEDMNRSRGSDDDFNDAIFFVTSNPITAVETSDMEVISYSSDDKDNDGVSDNYDDYPNDKTRAFNNYYPSEGSFGTLAFEDLWPGKGDYDFNDLVIDYSINEITNADNKVVEIDAEYVVRAVGASYEIGFGFQMDILPSKISGVSGLKHTENMISLDANNTESGHDKATVILFDHARKLFPSSPMYINTEKGGTMLKADTVHLKISFTDPVKSSELGYAPYNPFIFTDQSRGREIHLPDYEPTAKADQGLFGTREDDSKPTQSRYYKSRENHPWAIHVVREFKYPVEKTDIIKAYKKFGFWARSSGSTYSDWYLDKTGYRSPTKLY